MLQLEEVQQFESALLNELKTPDYYSFFTVSSTKMDSDFAFSQKKSSVEKMPNPLATNATSNEKLAKYVKTKEFSYFLTLWYKNALQNYLVLSLSQCKSSFDPTNAFFGALCSFCFVIFPVIA